LYYYVDILGVLVGLELKENLQVDEKKTKLNVIAKGADGQYSVQI